MGNHESKVGDCIGKVLATNKQTNSANINIDEDFKWKFLLSNIG